jgi:hypothetical protein
VKYSALNKTLVMQLQSAGGNRFPVLAHMTYDAEDPFAVTMVFSHNGRSLASWRLDRDMLADGLRRRVGEGDVRMHPQATGAWDELCIDFYGEPHHDGGRRHATVFAWAAGVDSFLQETYVCVPRGEEQVRVDDFLSELLANG